VHLLGFAGFRHHSIAGLVRPSLVNFDQHYRVKREMLPAAEGMASR
jgi:hypothetical protein